MAQIILTIPNEKLVEFKTGFLAIYPVPIDGDSKSKTYGQPLYTELQWFKEWLKQEAIRTYRNGKYKLATQTVQIDEEIII